MSIDYSAKNVLVTGATGFIGQWLVPELLNKGFNVFAAMRNAEQRQSSYRETLIKRGVSPEHLYKNLQVVDYDLASLKSLQNAIDPNRHELHVVYHLAAAYGWGLDKHKTEIENVQSSLALLDWLQKFSQLERFIWIGGYRVAAHDQAQTEAQLFKKLGSYEASKIIAHQKIIDKANALNIPWTALNPSTVIGDSQTGETTQFIGVAEMVQQLYLGKMPLIPGSKKTFVPLVHVDFVAKFAAAIPDYSESVGQQYWLLDSETPRLANLVKQIARHLGVKAPRFLAPVKLLKIMPAFLLPSPKETLAFLSDDEYDVENTQKLAEKMGINHLLPARNINAWIDSLMAQNFGANAGF